MMTEAKMKILMATAFALIVLTLTGCPKKVPVPERVVLQRNTEISNINGNLDVNIEGDERRNGNNNATDTLHKNTGIKLRPGDVIYLRRWFPNTYDREESLILNLTTPASYVERIPLRKVGPNSILYANERELLASILTVNRSCLLRTADEGTLCGLARFLQTNETKIWNLFVDHIKVKRLRVQNDEQNLVITVSLNDLFEDLKKEPSLACEANRYRYFFNPLPLPDSACNQPASSVIPPPCPSANPTTKPTPPPCPIPSPTTVTPAPTPENMKSEEEIFGQEDPMASPWFAIVGKLARPPYNPNPYYYARKGGTSPNDDPSMTIFNFVTVEFNGINVSRPQFPETLWTLADLERSEICVEADLSQKPIINKIVFNNDRHAYKIIRNKSEGTPTYLVTFTTDHDNRPLRQIVRNEAVNGDCWSCQSIAVSDLERIYLEDVKKIEWIVQILDPKKNKKRRAQLVNPNNCYSK